MKVYVFGNKDAPGGVGAIEVAEELEGAVDGVSFVFVGRPSLPAPAFLLRRGAAGLLMLTVWVYRRSGNLLVAMLLPARLTAITLFTLVPRATGAILAVHYPILIAVLCVVVGAVAVANGGDSRESRFRKRVA